MVKPAWIIHGKKWSVIFSLILPLNSSTVKIKQRENSALNISQIMAHNYKQLIILLFQVFYLVNFSKVIEYDNMNI